MEHLPAEVVSVEIFARCAEFAPALRAVCRKWHGAAFPQRASRSEGLSFLALGGHTDLLCWVRALCAARGAPLTVPQLDSMLASAARGGHGLLGLLVKKWGAANFDDMLRWATMGGHEPLCRLAKKWGATDFSDMLSHAAYGGHERLCVLAKEWGAADFGGMLLGAALGGHEALRLLADEWIAQP
jgi:hypothetical protein